jgi:hypothetical protein
MSLRFGWLAFICLVAGNCYGQQPAGGIDRYNVVWNSPSRHPYESMPIGNGDIGLNVWVEEDGDLLFYIAKTDSWSENARLLKLGRVRIKLDPNPFRKGLPFRQELKLRQGEIEITAGGEEETILRIWVDAHHPVINVGVEGRRDIVMQVHLETWRNKAEELRTWKHRRGDMRQTAIGDVFNVLPPEQPYKPPYKTIVYPDTVVDGLEDRIVWYHFNQKSAWPINMKLQGLDDFMKTSTDPLLRRAFGGMIVAEGFTSIDPDTLQAVSPSKRHAISIYVLTDQPSTVDQWTARIENTRRQVESIHREQRRAAHREWWEAFWNRSWIYADGAEDAETVTLGYTLQRYMFACAGRGAQPIKFNGSLFTVNDPDEGGNDPDYRRWGPGYWAQNTRLVYWALLASGDYDLMAPFFRMYSDALDMARKRTELYFGHGGAFFPETMYFWGTYANDHYGWQRQGKPLSHVVCAQIARHWQSGLETSAIMLDYYAHTQDERFAQDVLVPFADAVIDFYDQHYGRDESGKLRIAPAQALETWHDCVNPMPEVAGLRFVLPRLLALPEHLTGVAQRKKWVRLERELPEVPLRNSPRKGFDRNGREFRFPLLDGLPALAPAEKFDDKWNAEDPELYAVFPYRLFGIGKREPELGIRAVKNRMGRRATGWCQVDIQMACLGMTDEARAAVARRSTLKHKTARFPAMWQSNADWIPDQDHGAVLVKAIQTMLMQCDNEAILLFPAWPADWDVRFKLHAPYKTTVEGELKNGELIALNVTPEKRRNDLVDMLKQKKDATQ